MSRLVDPEETAALAVLAELGRTPGSEDTRVTSAEDEVEDVLRRLDLEAVGLLAYGLEPAAPQPGAREELLARLGGDATQEVAPVAGPEPAAAAAPAPRAEPAARAQAPTAPRPAAIWPELAAEPKAEGAAAPPPVAVFAERSAARRPRPSRTARWLAAVFALAALGAGGWGVWLASELASDRGRLARLERDLGRLQAQHEAESAALQARLTAAAERAAFVSGPAELVFALKPPPGSPQPLARGKLWVAGDHQHWQLDAAGLAPSPEGREYQVWFLVDGAPRSGGTFGVGRDERTGTLGSARMPAGTAGVTITLERAGGVPVPTGPVLLLADQAVEL